jgi:hypothetical protein
VWLGGPVNDLICRARATHRHRDKVRTLGQQNNDPNAAIYKANYERVHAKVKESTRKQ